MPGTLVSLSGSSTIGVTLEPVKPAPTAYPHTVLLFLFFYFFFYFVFFCLFF